MTSWVLQACAASEISTFVHNGEDDPTALDTTSYMSTASSGNNH